MIVRLNLTYFLRTFKILLHGVLLGGSVDRVSSWGLKTTTKIHFSSLQWQSFQITMDTTDTGEEDEVVALLYYF